MSGGVSAIATGFIAVFTVKLFQVNNRLSEIAKNAEDVQIREIQQQVSTTRMSVDHQLRVAESQLRVGIDTPRFLMTVALNSGWSERPSEHELARAFAEDELDVVFRAFMAIQTFAETTISYDGDCQERCRHPWSCVPSDESEEVPNDNH